MKAMVTLGPIIVHHTDYPVSRLQQGLIRSVISSFRSIRSRQGHGNVSESSDGNSGTEARALHYLGDINLHPYGLKKPYS